MPMCWRSGGRPDLAPILAMSQPEVAPEGLRRGTIADPIVMNRLPVVIFSPAGLS